MTIHGCITSNHVCSLKMILIRRSFVCLFSMTRNPQIYWINKSYAITNHETSYMLLESSLALTFIIKRGFFFKIFRDKLFYKSTTWYWFKVQSLCVECFPDTRSSEPWYMQMVWIFYNTSNTAVLTSTLLLGSLLPLSTYISFVLVIKAMESLPFHPTFLSPNGEGLNEF